MVETTAYAMAGRSISIQNGLHEQFNHEETQFLASVMVSPNCHEDNVAK